MTRLGLGVAGATIALMSGTAAHAYDGDWYVHAGPAQLTLADEAKVRLAGAEVPGAGYASDAQTTTVVEIGRRLGDHWAASVTIGAPPKAEASGSGSIAAIGMLGSATYGPAAFTVHYHFNPDGAFQPYVGVGASYMHIFDTSDGAMTNLNVEDTFGPVLQIGAEYRVNERWGAFIDIKQAWLTTEASGSLGGAPVSADMVFDPLVINLGIGYSF